MPAIGGGVLSFLAYGLVIWAMRTTPMAYVSGLRETSVILATIIGTRFMGEPFGRERVTAACIYDRMYESFRQLLALIEDCLPAQTCRRRRWFTLHCIAIVSPRSPRSRRLLRRWLHPRSDAGPPEGCLPGRCTP